MKSAKMQRTGDMGFSAIPWNTPALWRAVNDSLSAAIDRNPTAMTGIYPLANCIRKALKSLFPTMDDLCRDTCTACTAICCRRAYVWADFKDLLFLHIAGIAVPEQQLLAHRNDHCRFQNEYGCRLDRLQRPFVCTWYVCPAQTHLLSRMPEQAKSISQTLYEIKAMRRKLEEKFILTVAG